VHKRHALLAICLSFRGDRDLNHNKLSYLESRPSAKQFITLAKRQWLKRPRNKAKDLFRSAGCRLARELRQVSSVRIARAGAGRGPAVPPNGPAAPAAYYPPDDKMDAPSRSGPPSGRAAPSDQPAGPVRRQAHKSARVSAGATMIMRSSQFGPARMQERNRLCYIIIF